MASPHRSPPRDADPPTHALPQLPALETSPSHSQAIASGVGDTAVVMKMEASGAPPGGFRVVASIVRRDRMAVTLRQVSAVARASAVVLSLVAFSVMVSDKTQGWAGDSFDRYREYRYLVAVNVLVFVYSGFQMYAHLHRVISKRHLIHFPIRLYFDFGMDQVMAYLLMSASSSAATRNADWVTSWGSDEFTNRASGAITMSFLAFFALAICSLVSSHNLFAEIH